MNQPPDLELAPRCPVTSGIGITQLVDPAFHGRGAAHPVWAGMRRHAPVARQSLPDGREFWSVTSFREVTEVLQDAVSFTSEQGTLLSLLGRGDPAGGSQLVATDPPRHTPLRKPVQRALAIKSVQARMMEPLRRVVRDTLAPLADGGPYDLAAHLRLMAVAVMGVIMDLPAEDRPRLAELGIASIAPADPHFGRPGAAEAVLAETHRELLSYFHELVRDRRARPGDDLVSLLIKTEWDGRPLSQGEVVSNCYSLLLGGSVTTSQVPASTLDDLMGTAQLAAWAADPSSLASGVEEALRWSTPNIHFMRYAVRDVEIGGQRIQAGEAVVVWLASANFDEAAFPSPFEFDARRRPNKHLTFGAGPHYCVGHSVVRETLKLFFAELFDSYTDLAPAGPGVRLHSNVISGWASMPVTAKRSGND